MRHIQNCSEQLDYEKTSKLVQERCEDQPVCHIPIGENILRPQYKGSLREGEQSECDENAYFFMQAPCLYPSTEVVWREIVGLAVSCWAVFIYFFTLTFFQYIQCV